MKYKAIIIPSNHTQAFCLPTGKQAKRELNRGIAVAKNGQHDLGPVVEVVVIQLPERVAVKNVIIRRDQ